VTSAATIAALTRRLAPDVARIARVTPLEELTHLSRPGRPVWAKREDVQVTGSFKVRGVAAKLATLAPAEIARGVWAASTGNHGLAVADVAARYGVPAHVMVPDSARSSKVARIAAAGAEVVAVSGNAIGAEREARRAAQAGGGTYVSPYNDPAVVAGQGTIGLELLDQIGERFTLVVAVGGGGLVSGIAATVRARALLVVGTSPVVDAAMAASVRAGRVVAVDGAPTLSDGTAGDLEPHTITFESCRSLVDRWVLQPEERIARALERHRETTGGEVEGSAALALATAEDLDVEGPVVVIVCGGNV
jgi:threonine dehydratase